MDLILGRYLDDGYEQLDAPGRDAFNRLLDIPDQVVYAWILGHEETEDTALRALVDDIRARAAPNLG